MLIACMTRARLRSDLVPNSGFQGCYFLEMIALHEEFAAEMQQCTATFFIYVILLLPQL